MKKDLFIDIANIVLSFIAIFCMSVAFLPYYGTYERAVKKVEQGRSKTINRANYLSAP
jgi:hypothetical protein